MLGKHRLGALTLALLMAVPAMPRRLHAQDQAAQPTVSKDRLSLTVRKPSGTVIKRKISPRLLATRMAVTMGDTWMLLPA